MGHDGFLPKPKGRYLRLCRTVAWLGILFRSVCERGSRKVSAVCDLELRPGPVLGGRPRTAANETRTETGAASVPNGFQERP